MSPSSDDETSPFKMPDYGVYTGEQNPRQSVTPPLPKTQQIPVAFPPSYPPHREPEQASDEVFVADEEVWDEEHSEDEPEYSFRRHWREPLLRILPTPYAPKSYLWLLLAAMLVLAITTAWYAATGLDWILFVGCATAVMLAAYPTIREIYRWRKRIVTIYRTDTGVRIAYQEPDKILLGFNGDGDGNVTVLEGSTEFNSHINWPNKLVFWGCGDLLIAGKVEAGGSPPLLENVPHIKRVRQFLNEGN